MRCHRVARPGLLSVPILALAASLSFGQSASAGWLWPGPAPIQRVQFFSHMLHPAAVAEILYVRYGMARVLYVQPRGDVYYADALDRRGYRVSFAVDAYNGRVLESFIVGRRPYGAGIAPRDDVERPAPQRSRRAMLPRDTHEVEPGPRTRATPKREQRGRATVSRQPSTQPIVPETAPRREKTPATAARPVSPGEPDRRQPNLAPTAPAPEPVRPAIGPPQGGDPSASEPARQAGPVSRVPEPLIDPRTGRRNPSLIDVPPAPLDDTSPRRRTLPAAPVPPASLE
jgi:hypothetical protein